MKRNVLVLLHLCVAVLISANSSAQIFSTNRNPVGLEHNLLFRANERYAVSTVNFDNNTLPYLFDGSFGPVYNMNTSISNSNPSVILIEGLPNSHIQAGAWVGWSTRYCPVVKFKIEAYNVYNTSEWVTVADYSNTTFNGNDFSVALPFGSFTKLKYTFYEGQQGCLNGGIAYGISELFFIHPEATTPYYGLFEVSGSTWTRRGNNINYNSGNVGIGIVDPQNKLDVNGTIHAREVKVDLIGWADYVFAPTYKLRPLSEVEQFIKTNGHLPEIPKAEEVKQNGVNLGEMQTKLLQKVEELTLYSIEQSKENAELKQKLADYEKEMKELKKLLMGKLK
jgi:hypothetical protein